MCERERESMCSLVHTLLRPGATYATVHGDGSREEGVLTPIPPTPTPTKNDAMLQGKQRHER